ncbi:hypothetical protein LCGC14_1012480 [marine sediment metagenome]|uniref:Uncharacterized protein n=1 Tax=marine sediment metagenome TaxID=412755 RepID=A0A0F9NLC1_9ZZZZ
MATEAKTKTATTFGEFWNEHDIVEVFAAGNGCPGGQTLTDTTDDETVAGEDYCDLWECLEQGFIRTPDDDEASSFSGYAKLEGEVSEDGTEWTWNGEGKAWDCRCNDYCHIKIRAATI